MIKRLSLALIVSVSFAGCASRRPQRMIDLPGVPADVSTLGPPALAGLLRELAASESQALQVIDFSDGLSGVNLLIACRLKPTHCGPPYRAALIGPRGVQDLVAVNVVSTGGERAGPLDIERKALPATLVRFEGAPVPARIEAVTQLYRAILDADRERLAALVSNDIALNLHVSGQRVRGLLAGLFRVQDYRGRHQGRREHRIEKAYSAGPYVLALGRLQDCGVGACDVNEGAPTADLFRFNAAGKVETVDVFRTDL